MGLLLAATGGGAVFWVGWSVYNRVLRKKLIGLFCGDCERVTPVLYVWLLNDFFLPICGSFANA